jgi:hypothetical protein
MPEYIAKDKIKAHVIINTYKSKLFFSIAFAYKTSTMNSIIAMYEKTST